MLSCIFRRFLAKTSAGRKLKSRHGIRYFHIALCLLGLGLPRRRGCSCDQGRNMKSSPEKTTRTLQRRQTGESAARAKTKTPARVLSSPPVKPSAGLQWTFLTNHSHVLVLISRNPSVVLREVAMQVGITERAVQRIIADLEAGGIIEREKIGRQNHYRIQANQPLRHPIESHRTIGDLLILLNQVPE